MTCNEIISCLLTIFLGFVLKAKKNKNKYLGPGSNQSKSA